MTAELRAEQPIWVDCCWLVPVVAVSRADCRLGHIRFAYFTKEPRALVVLGPEGTRALSITGDECDLGEMQRNIVGLAATLASLAGAAH